VVGLREPVEVLERAFVPAPDAHRAGLQLQRRARRQALHIGPEGVGVAGDAGREVFAEEALVQSPRQGEALDERPRLGGEAQPRAVEAPEQRPPAHRRAGQQQPPLGRAPERQRIVAGEEAQRRLAKPLQRRQRQRGVRRIVARRPGAQPRGDLRAVVQPPVHDDQRAGRMPAGLALSQRLRRHPQREAQQRRRPVAPCIDAVAAQERRRRPQPRR
jgi:hypothetical protein